MWGAWRSCSKTCGGGIQNRVRECLNSDFPDVSCEGGTSSQSQDCNEGQCRKFPLHCMHDKFLCNLEEHHSVCPSETNSLTHGLYDRYCLCSSFNPRLTRGGGVVATPLPFFRSRSETLKKVI